LNEINITIIGTVIEDLRTQICYLQIKIRRQIHADRQITVAEVMKKLES